VAVDKAISVVVVLALIIEQVIVLRYGKNHVKQARLDTENEFRSNN
jgi:hypothetical protein